MIYPAHFEQKVGFDGIRKLLNQYCISPMGQEKVEEISFSYHADSIRKSLDETAEFLKLMQTSVPFPVRDYSDLRPELNRIRIEGTVIEQENLFELKHNLNAIDLILKFAKSEASLSFPALRGLCSGLVLDQIILKEVNRLTDDKGDIPDHASEELASIRRQIRQKLGTIDRKIRQILGEAKKSGWADSDVEATIRNGRLVIPVRASDKRSIRGFIHDESSTGQTVYIEPAEVFDTNNEIKELEYAEKREINRILASFTRTLRPQIPMMAEAWELLGMIDLTRSKALLAQKLRASNPKIVDEPKIWWKEARHPLLELKLLSQKKTIVPLDLELNSAERILVISGPNAGGKSVCLKTTGLLQYMLQCGLAVPMKPESECGLFAQLFIDIGDEQSLENDLSTYSSHLMNMKYFLEHASERTLFLIDEFGTGTEPQLGGAIAEAVLNELNDQKSFGLVTTHYANLKLLADNENGIINGAMLFDTRKLQPLYLLQTGKPGSSFAFEIARKIGFPEVTLQSAASITGQSHLDFEQQLQQLEIEKKEVAQKQLELRLADNLLNEVIEKYKRLLKQLEERKKQLLGEASREAKSLIDKANRQIELTIKEIREVQAEKEATKTLRSNLQQSKAVFEQEAEAAATALVVKEETEEAVETDLNVGDQVMIEEMDVVGELLSISEHEAVISFHSVKLRTSPEKLRKLSKTEVRKSNRMQNSQQGRKGTIGEDLNEKVSNFKLTIDLRGKRAEEALEQVAKYIDEAILISVKEINILHGKGNGILRRIIREFLSKQKEIASFQDASPEAGGNGITKVVLK